MLFLKSMKYESRHSFKNEFVLFTKFSFYVKKFTEFFVWIINRIVYLHHKKV